MKLNPQVEKIIDESLRDTGEFGWDEDDRKWSACGTALKYAETQGLDGTGNPALLAVIQAAVEQKLKAEK